MSSRDEKNYIYDSDQHSHPALDELRQVINYRTLIFQLVRRDILTRYKRSFLGIVWTLLNPLGMMLVLTVAFSQIFRFDTVYSYATYVLSGLLAWSFFSQTTTAAMVNLIWGGGLLNRIYIPRSSFALAAIGTGLVNIALSTIPLLLVMLITKTPIKVSLVLLPLPILLLAFFSLGVGLLISTVAVYFPDVSEMYQIVITAWLYITPVIYPEDILPETIRSLITTLNPMHHLVKIYRLIVYNGQFPTWYEIWPGVLISIVMLAIGWWFFSSKSNDFAYRI